MAANQHLNPWTADEDVTLRALHGAGKSLNAIATEMGRAKATISDHAAALGLDFDRTRTAKAAEAVHVDNKARRVVIVARMYTRIEKLQDRLDAAERDGEGFKTILKGSFGVEETKTLNFVPTVDERNIADTLSRYVASATKLEAVDATGGVDRERSLLSELGAALGVHGPDQT